MNPIAQFNQEREERVEAYQTDSAFRQLSQTWLESSMRKKYVYNFDWLGRPIISIRKTCGRCRSWSGASGRT